MVSLAGRIVMKAVTDIASKTDAFVSLSVAQQLHGQGSLASSNKRPLLTRRRITVKSVQAGCGEGTT